ncbi:hypothetical protein BXZ70DRAFT_13224 [Cristinia sonorae]|uniref:Large ribosomal subunit protein bL28c n=1 Tax=Cristinia sonorae TaxID=1940300 RepID=A0A8K0XUP8_9AGAR|nr:hypothetical protein BXZ70DRAFT_13224 [Cristinia sonorae]
MLPSLPLLKSAVTAVVSQPFKRAQLGLFQGKTKQYGNNVPFSKHKTRRSWLPNVQSKRLFSDTLDQFVKVKLTTRALKTIKKHGGIDNYVLKTKPELLGWEGMRIRVLVREQQQARGISSTISTSSTPTPTIVLSETVAAVPAVPVP